MALRSQLPGNHCLLWLRLNSIRIGVLTGVYVSAAFVTWLLIANRVPELAPFAGIRNAIAGATITLFLLIPVVRFRNRPAKLFVAGATAWTVLTLTYVAMEIHFSLLNSRMGALNLFVLGIVSYGFISVLHWVLMMCALVRRRHRHEDAPVAVTASRRTAH